MLNPKLQSNNQVILINNNGTDLELTVVGYEKPLITIEHKENLYITTFEMDEYGRTIYLEEDKDEEQTIPRYFAS